MIMMASATEGVDLFERNCILCNEIIVGEEEWENHPKSRKHNLALIKYYLKTNRQLLIANKGNVIFTSDSKDVDANEVNGTLAMNLSVGSSLNIELLIENTNASLPVQLISCYLLQRTSTVEIKDRLNFSAGINHVVLESEQKYRCAVTVTATETCKMSVPVVLQFAVNAEKHVILRDLIISCYHNLSSRNDLVPEEPYTRPATNFHLFDRCEVIPFSLSELEAETLPVQEGDYYPRKGNDLYPLPDQLVMFVANRLNMPKNMNKFDQQQIYYLLSDLAKGLNEDNYVDYFSTLLFFEEAQLKVDIRKYDLHDVSLNQVDSTDLLSLSVPGLAEKRPSLMKGDKIYIRLFLDDQHLDDVEYEGMIIKAFDHHINVSFNPIFLDNLYIKGMRFNVRFSVNRYPLIKSHQALNYFPEISHILFPLKDEEVIDHSNETIRFYNRDIEKNQEQKRAIENIVKGTSKPFPFLLFGPPGTGKTVTLVEAIKQVWFKNKKKAILVCAPSNSAADLITEKLLEHIPEREIFRLNAAMRNYEYIPEKVKKCSNWDGNQFYFPRGKVVQEYRIVISTVVSAGRLLSSGLVKGHFHYVFVDESGQCMEPEVLIAIAGLLKLSKSKKKSGMLVLAGDPKQLGAVLRNPVAIKKGLGISLLERLMENFDVYLSTDGKFNPLYVVKLLQNYRSHPVLLQLPNKLFYDEELKACGNEVLINSLCNWPHLKRKGFPFMFHSVIGQDAQERSSPSYFNVEEVDVVLEYVRMLLKPTKGVVLKPKDIGIISPYRRQVEKIRCGLKKMKLQHADDLVVGSTEEFQGQERRIIIISTVRSCPDLLAMDFEHHIGFLRNPKRFNVAITRAVALLIVVGNPLILHKDYHWREMINYCVQNKSFIGRSLRSEEQMEDVLERCAYFGLRPETVNLAAAEAHCVSQKTKQEEPKWRWEH